MFDLMFGVVSACVCPITLRLVHVMDVYITESKQPNMSCVNNAWILAQIQWYPGIKTSAWTNKT